MSTRLSSAPRWQLAAAGVVTGLAGLATSQATVWALRTRTSPVVAVSSLVRDKTPGDLAPKLVHLVGHLDKPLLIGGTIVVLLAICAAAGLLTRSHPLVPDLIFFALAGLGIVAVLHQQGTGLGDGLAVVVGFITWIVVLRLLTWSPGASGRATDAASASATVDLTRRSFLVRSSGVVLGALAVGAIGRFASRSRRAVDEARRLLRLPVTRGQVPAGSNLDLPGLAPWRTPNSQFYRIDTSLAAPSIRPSEWELRVHGMVDRELRLSYSDLVGRQATQDWVTICCVSNEVGGPLIGNAWWSGVLISDVLAEVGVHPDADAVRQTSYDGWTCGTPLSALTDDRNAMLAFAMNGQPLPIEHGFPVRMIVPGLYGYVSATKWLVDLEVTRFDKFTGYWTDRGWSVHGPIKTESRIDVPRNGGSVKAGSVPVGGSAWAQHVGIETVEYQLDGGPWLKASLGRVPSNDTWVQWSGSVNAKPGKHELRVRATDRSGYQQTSVRVDVVPNGATGWHTVGFEAT